MTAASLLHFCSDSYQAHPMISGHLSREKTCHCRESQASTDEVWKTSNKTDKIQHSPFCTETSMLGLATSASLFSRKSKWSWWILETDNPEQRFFFFFFATVFVLSAFWTESQSTDLGTPGSEVPWVTGHDFWWWLCQSVLSSLEGVYNICWCPGSTC